MRNLAANVWDIISFPLFFVLVPVFAMLRLYQHRKNMLMDWHCWMLRSADEQEDLQRWQPERPTFYRDAFLRELSERRNGVENALWRLRSGQAMPRSGQIALSSSRKAIAP